MGWLGIGDLKLSFIGPFYRGDANFQEDIEFSRLCLLEFLTPRQGLLQMNRCIEDLPDPLLGGLEGICPFYLHSASPFQSAKNREATTKSREFGGKYLAPCSMRFAICLSSPYV